MPNNANARREKDKKKKDKKKKTDPAPLHKEDRAITDCSSSSLSLAGKDKASVDGTSRSLSPGRKEIAVDPSDPKYLERVLLLEHAKDLSKEDRSIMRGKIRSEIRKSNPGLSADEDKFKSLMHEGMVEAALEARKRKSQSTLSLSGQEKASRSDFDLGADETSMETFFRSYEGRGMETLEAELSASRSEQHVFVRGYKHSLPISVASAMFGELLKAYLNTHARDWAEPSRVRMLKAGLEALKDWRKSQSTKDSSLSLLPLGTAKKAASLSACAEPKVDIPLRGKNSSSSLTDEEKASILSAVSIELKIGTPNADDKALHEKYKIALWDAEVKKSGGKPGTNLGNVDLTSPSASNDEEDCGEDSDSSEDDMKAIRDDLARQRQVSPPSSPKENRFLAGFMKPSEKHQQDAQAE
jgi:hypothetical protein